MSDKVRRKRNPINNLIKICLDIAEYYDAKGNENEQYLGDEMCDTIGLGYRALTGYLREGVKEVISLQSSYHTVTERLNYEKGVQKDNEKFIEELFGRKDAADFYSDEEKARIRALAEQITAEVNKELEE